MTASGPPESLDLTRLSARLRAGTLSVAALIEDVLARIEAAGDDRVWIERVPAAVLRAKAAQLDRQAAADAGVIARRPLFGIPFAVKDNIDVAGMPTTAACPAYAYRASATASAVARLEEAGALLVGKTNLDQFATGLVGCRSPYGVPRNPFDARYVPGGSSSGSAVAVAAGLVSFALGTDTAGSGRVPAAFNNIVGLKPTRGRVSIRGVVPACRSLDCLSIFALSCEDAAGVLAICGVYDAEDPFSRRPTEACETFPPAFRFAVPPADDLAFFGDDDAPALFAGVVAALEHLGGERVEADFAPFRAAGQLLYDGPWVAERLAAIEDLVRREPATLFPATRQIIAGGERYRAVDAFRASYRLAELRRAAERLWERAEVLLLPTAATIPTVAAVEADPFALNARLGYYTNFVNLLDLAAIAVPAGFRPDGLPFGVSLAAPAFCDGGLAALGAGLHRRLDLPLGATPHRLPPASPRGSAAAVGGRIEIAVASAHLSGLPLNAELVDHGARYLRSDRTAPIYRMFRLAGEPARPGLVRCGEGGRSVAVEIWSLSVAAFGAFVAAIPPPLTIGTLVLDGGFEVKGFLCETAAAGEAEDISAFAGWRDYLLRRC